MEASVKLRYKEWIAPAEGAVCCYSLSKIIAAPIPPAAQTVTSPYCSPVSCSSLQTVVTMRAPLQTRVR